jgi:hypothetical protein
MNGSCGGSVALTLLRKGGNSARTKPPPYDGGEMMKKAKVIKRQNYR